MKSSLSLGGLSLGSLSGAGIGDDLAPKRGPGRPRKDPFSITEGASSPDKRKQSLYFPEAMLSEMKEEATRLDRSLSWVVQRAWKVAKEQIAHLPTIDGDDSFSSAADAEE